MEKFKKFIKKAFNWVGYDGMLHFPLSALIVVCISTILPLWLAVLAGIVAGASKEAYDIMCSGLKDFDWHHCAHDVLCDIAGIAFGLTIAVIFIVTR